MQKNTPQNKDYRALLSAILGSRPVAYYPALARRVGGVKAAVMLSQLLYWSFNSATQNRDGWFYKTIEEMEEETGLSRWEQEGARKDLQNRGLIETQTASFPAKHWYRVSMDSLIDFLSLSVYNKVEKQQSGKATKLENNNVVNPPVSGFSTNSKTYKLEAPVNNELNIDYVNQEEEEDSSSSSSLSASAEKTNKLAYKNLDQELVTILLDLGVFESKLPEIDASGLPADALRDLVQQVKKQDKQGQPAALFMHRIKNRLPPRNKYAVPPPVQPEPEPTDHDYPPTIDPVPDGLSENWDQIKRDVFNPMSRADFSSFIQPIELYGMVGQEVWLKTTNHVWVTYIEPKLEILREHIKPFGPRFISYAE